MPNKSGHEFINYLKTYYPDIVRIVLTGHANMDLVLSAVNNGEVYRYMLKPWNDFELKMIIYKAAEYLELKRENGCLTAQLNNINRNQVKL